MDRVPREGLAAYAAAARGPGGVPFTVFDREDGRALVAAAGDRDAMVIRHILPAGPNDKALGVNVLSAPVAREALLAALQGEAAVLSGLFPLTQ
ncbi:CHASE domain-containing protein, partial [Clostridium perfringens]|nr:CHASE domain-containing protein [Clostridium perfringens]